MNASTSSSSSSSSVTTSQAARPKRTNLSFVRPVLSCGGALIIGAVLVRVLPAPTPSANAPQTTPVVVEPIVLPASQVVQARLASLPGAKGRTLTGTWKLTTDVTGKARSSGAVARWVVEPGSHVNAGDSVVEISSGSASRPVTGAEAQQNQAEQEQVQAARFQTKLAQNLSIAQTQLGAAQERVAHAQERVASARVLVKRLLAGEKVPVEGTRPRPSHSLTSQRPQTAKISREQRQALDAATQAKTVASDAKNELDKASDALTKAQKQSTSSATALTKAENDFKAEKVTADVLQNARADADDAATALKSAQTRVDVAERAYAASQQKIKTAEAAATEARTTAQSSPTPQTATVESPEESGRYMTADEAATLVQSALQESKAATRQAERIHARVEDYQRQVRQSSERANTASKDLQEAQQHVLDSVPRPTFTTTRAPVSGIVTWISRLAREVGVGQSVFGISQGRQGILRFEDTTEAWKKLRVGQTLNAASPQPQVEPSDRPQSSSPSMPASNLPAAGTSQPAVPLISPTQAPASVFSVRITRISPPTAPGEPAQIDAVVADGTSPAATGTGVIQAELPLSALPTSPKSPQAATSQNVVVPLSVVLPRNGSSYVAVLSPTSEADSPQDETPNEKEMTLEWRPIEIKAQTAFDAEVASGLHAGEQLVDQPALLLAQSKPEEKKLLQLALDTSD